MNAAVTGALGRFAWSSIRDYVMEGWREALAWPLFAWLRLEEPVRLIKADGAEQCLIYRSGGWRNLSRGRGAVYALELPSDLVLLREFVLPALPPADLARIVAQEVAKSSPFASANTIYGFDSAALDAARVRVRCAIAGRDQVGRYLADHPLFRAKTIPEVWAPGEPGLSFPGFGEAKRARRRRWRQSLAAALCVSACGLAASLWATPVMQKRLRAIQATLAFEQLQRKSEPHVKLRERFQSSGTKLEEALSLLDMPIEPLALIEDLSKTFSDDEWVSELRIKGNTVQVLGEGGNASKLLQTLGEHARFKEVKATAASVKNGTRESFSFEFKMAPEMERE